MIQVKARLGILQRVLPDYRSTFFDALAAICLNGLGVFAGQARPEENIAQGKLHIAHFFPANNLHFLHGKRYLCWQRGVMTWLEHWQPKVLIVEANPRYLHLPIAIRWMHNRGLPVIGWGLGAPPAEKGFFAALRQTARRKFIRQFEALITYSQTGANQYRDAGFNPERIFVAPNAVAPKPTEPPTPRPDAFLDEPTLLFVGRLQERKRVDLLISACAALAPQHYPRLWIVGDGPAKNSLETLARQIYPKTKFFGARRAEELQPFFRQADLFILPGTGGLAIQQAMSFALPVIAAEADGTQADLVRQANGWQIPPGNLEALVSTLKIALSDPARLRSMGSESYRIVAEEINLEKMVEVFANAVHTVWEK